MWHFACGDASIQGLARNRDGNAAREHSWSKSATHGLRRCSGSMGCGEPVQPRHKPWVCRSSSMVFMLRCCAPYQTWTSAINGWGFSRVATSNRSAPRWSAMDADLCSMVGMAEGSPWDSEVVSFFGVFGCGVSWASLQSRSRGLPD